MERSSRALTASEFEESDSKEERFERSQERRRSRLLPTSQILLKQFKQLFREKTGKEFPSNPEEQLRRAIEAVLHSWMGNKAIEYRRYYKIDDKMGTAVSIVAMVYGNTGENSGSGVGFTRNPSTGEKHLFAEFLINAQGEDVVSGARTPFSIEEIQEKMPDIHRQIINISNTP